MMQPAAALSVVIPTLNEAAHIAGTIGRLQAMAEDIAIECIVADGGSGDDTCALAAGCGARVIVSDGGRGAQLNAGAALARAPLLLFLHADCAVPADYAASVRAALGDPGLALAAFRLAIAPADWQLRLVAAGANLRSRWLGLPYGDQGLALRADDFARLGGFRPLPIMEDYDLVRRARGLGRIVIMDSAVTASARRWQRLGVLRTTLTNQAMLAGHALGVAPARLARWYRGR